MWVCMTDSVLLVSCEQPADSDSMKFNYSYLTCQQSEDLTDQMCLVIKASSCVGTSVCLVNGCVCLSDRENHANV